MISGLLEKYKQHRKQSWLNEAKKLSGKYAFIGVGSHSLSNLYPVLDFKGVGLKYIHSRTLKNAEDLAQKYPSCKGTDNLNDILSDPEIQGVFICAHPSVHFEITKAVLASGKHCFVEKPPCGSSEQLEELIKLQTDRHVVVGFQKVYSQVADKLRAVASEAISYSYSYHTGAYPEGDPVMDLFIHPCSVVVSLFGAVTDVKVQKSAGTWLVQIIHSSGVIGQLDLSTDYDWTNASEKITVNTKSASFTSNDVNSLIRTKHPRRVLGIPLEKVLKNPVVEEHLLRVNGFVPMAENNSLAVQGYSEEIDVFLKLSSGRKATNYSDLQRSKPIFELLEKLR